METPNNFQIKLFIAVSLHSLRFKMLYAISKDFEKANARKIVAPVSKVF